MPDRSLRRIGGAALLVGAYAPLHRLLDPALTGPAGEATRATAEAAWTVGLYGSVIVLGVALAPTLLVPEARLGGFVRGAGAWLAKPPLRLYATGLGLLAGVLSLAIALLLYHGFPTSVDEMAQLLNARAVAAGRLAMPVPGDPTAWSIQNGLVTPEGWVSIYPPLHTLLLAVGLRLGAAWAVGPVALGVATWASVLCFEELLGDRVGRAAGVVLAVSPFWLLLGGTHLSHATAAACIAVVLWSALRARTDGPGWALAAGAAMGAAVAARPWTGLVSSVTLLGVVWWKAERLGARLGALVVGGVPFAGLLFWWNDRLFGSPLRLGYSADFGEAHALGFHVDPWGNVYGATEAVGYTGADIVQLGAHLLETPLPAVAVVGAALLAGMRGVDTRPFLAWVGTALAANALYWHHGVHMGPRMLFETVPAWVALFVAASAYLSTQAAMSARLRHLAGWAVAVAGIGALILVRTPIQSAVRARPSASGAALPSPPTDRPALIFVHGSWPSRVVARLSAAGMRRDSVETALRRNDICAVDRYARWRASDPANRESAPPEVDLRPLPGRPAGLRSYQLAVGDVVWAEPGAAWDAPCTANATADGQGAFDIEPLLWQAPPLPGRPIVVARDMGRELNARIRSAFADRDAFVYTPVGGGGARPVLLDYEEGMELLWGPRPESGR